MIFILKLFSKIITKSEMLLCVHSKIALIRPAHAIDRSFIKLQRKIHFAGCHGNFMIRRHLTTSHQFRCRRRWMEVRWCVRADSSRISRSPGDAFLCRGIFRSRDDAH